MQQNSFKLLVFDWDGTLADSTDLIVAAMQAAINQLQFRACEDTQIREIIGLSLVDAARKLFPELEHDHHELLANSYRLHYMQHVHRTFLFQDVSDTLHTLRARGYHMAIATGKSRRGLDKSLKQTGLENFFHATRCADETSSKPHPQMLHEILDELEIRTDNAVMIGDSVYDMEMALNAGMHAIAVSYGVHGRARLLQYNPLVCLGTLGELLEWLPAPR